MVVAAAAVVVLSFLSVKSTIFWPFGQIMVDLF